MEDTHDSKPGAITLRDLHMGQTGIIRSVMAVGMARSRLLDLGFLFGTRVTAVRRAPFGDPTAYMVRGAVLALRAQDSSLVVVELVDGPQAQATSDVEAEPC